MGINFTRVTKNPLQDKDALVFNISGESRYTILAINPGSTSNKIAIYNGSEAKVELTLRHSAEELSHFASAIDQSEWRKSLILNTLAENNIDMFITLPDLFHNSVFVQVKCRCVFTNFRKNQRFQLQFRNRMR